MNSLNVTQFLLRLLTLIIMEGDLNDETRWNPLSSILRTNFGDDFLIKIFPTLQRRGSMMRFFITFNIPPKKFPSHDFTRLTVGIWWAIQ